jgi:hypothetical protein
MPDSGWVAPSTVTDLNDTDNNWTGEVNAIVNNSTYARCDTPTSEQTCSLRFLFDLDVPENAVIVGLELRYEAKSEVSAPFTAFLTKLVIDGAPTGDDLSLDDVIPTVDTLYTIGAEDDTLGYPITPAQANSGNAGFVISFEAGGDGGFVYVDYAQMRAHYTLPPVPTATEQIQYA